MSSNRFSHGNRILWLGIGAAIAMTLLAGIAFALGIRIRPSDSPDVNELQAFSEGFGEGADTVRMAYLGDLSDEIDESSGVAVSRRDDGVFWTHNDQKGQPFIYGVRLDGTIETRVQINGAEAEDWEDIALGRCPVAGGPQLACLFIADIGDNDAERDEIQIYVVPEPALSASSARVEITYRLTYPDGPTDAEAIAVLGDLLYLVSKGEDGSARLYRYVLGAPGSGVLELIGRLPINVDEREQRITAAAFSPDGAMLALRSFESVYLVSTRNPLSSPVVCSLGPEQPQGEGMDFLEPGVLLLSTEREDGRAPLIRARCP